MEMVQQFAEQQLKLEPWREEGQRHLIWTLAQQGKISSETVASAICDLGVDPEKADPLVS